MEKLTVIFLIGLIIAISVHSVAKAEAMPATQVVLESSFYGAALGALSVLGIGLIANNLSSVPWSTGVGIGIFGGMAMGIYEISTNPNKYSQAYSALMVAEVPDSVAGLRLISQM